MPKPTEKAAKKRAKASTPPPSVPAYIAAAPAPVRHRLRQLRAAIRRAAPDAVEGISYGIPYYALDGRLLYFAAFRAHIGVYPITPAAKTAFARQLAAYRTSKGGVQFPHDRPLPLALFTRLVRFRVRENRARARAGGRRARR